MTENNNEMEKLVEEYDKQLDLMKKQYGEEEDLYPWIYMLLMKSGKIQNLSMRQVAGAPWANVVSGREMLRGYAGFPDIAILDKEFCAINIDKDINDRIPNIVNWMVKSFPINIESNVIENILKFNINPSEEIKEFLKSYWFLHNIDKLRGCVEVKVINDKLIDIESETLLTINCLPDTYTEKFYRKGKRKFCYHREDVKLPNTNELKLGQYYEINYDELPDEAKESREFSESDEISCKIEKCINCFIQLENLLSKEKKNYTLNETDVKQLFGELLWYGKVLYTNGKKWSFLQVETCSNDKEIQNIVDLRKILYGTCVKFHEPLENWYERISKMQEKGLKIQINCKNKLDEEDLSSWIENKVNF